MEQVLPVIQDTAKQFNGADASGVNTDIHQPGQTELIIILTSFCIAIQGVEKHAIILKDAFSTGDGLDRFPFHAGSTEIQFFPKWCFNKPPKCTNHKTSIFVRKTSIFQ